MEHMEQFAAWVAPRRQAVRQLSVQSTGVCEDAWYHSTGEDEAALGSLLGALAGGALEVLELRLNSTWSSMQQRGEAFQLPPLHNGEEG